MSGHDDLKRYDNDRTISGPSSARDHESSPTRAFAPDEAPPPSVGAEGMTELFRAGTFGPGDVVAKRYRITSLLGEGGMGEVYEAEDLELGERVAVKTVRPEIANLPGATERFKREVLLARKITHPNVCRVLEFGYHSDEPNGTGGQPAPRVMFLTMELIQGETLSQRIRRCGTLDADEALPIIEQMAGALDAAHAIGIVHRDFKSGNVMLVSGNDGERVVVTDFGLARAAEGLDQKLMDLTTAGEALGTPAFMAPEQVEGKVAGPAADIYALGVVVFHMVTGSYPFAAETPLAMAAKRLNSDPISPHEINESVDADLERVILKCLARQPEDRYQRAGDVAAALRGEEAPTRQRRSNRRLAVAAATILTAALAGFMISKLLPFPTASSTTQTTTQFPETPSTLRPSIAVLGFKNSGRPEAAWLSTAISEMLRTELAANDQLRAIPGETVARMKSELEISDADSLSSETLARVRKNIGADYVALGSYVALGDAAGGQLRLELRLQETRSGEVVFSAPVTGTEADLFKIVTDSGTLLRKNLGVDQLTEVEAATVRTSLPASPRAARLYSEGLQRLRVYDVQAALELFQKARDIEPSHPLLHSAEASAWSALGYDQKAREAARRALELSGELSREERLSIEAQVHETANEWDKAAEIYHSLFMVFPDNVEHGLNLASAQINGGDADGAIETLTAIHALPEPAGTNPRIDIAEARAFKTLTDHDRQLEAASAASERAEAARARVLVASARLLEGDALVRLGRHDEGIARCDEARAIFQFFGDQSSVAEAENVIAVSHARRGDMDSALASFRQALEAFRAVGNVKGIGIQLTNIGNVLASQGETGEARRTLEKALASAEQVGDTTGIARAVNNLATIEWETGDLDAAAAHYEQALGMFRQVGAAGFVSLTLTNLGELLHAQGKLDESVATYREAIAAAQEVSSSEDLAYARMGLAAALLDRGQIAESLNVANAARTAFQELGDSDVEAQLLETMIAAHEAAGEQAVAARLKGELEALRGS